MSTFAHTYDLSMDKASSPPSISISLYEWVEDDFEIRGNFNDPDGDSVTITATNNQNSWGSPVVSGNTWYVKGPGFASPSPNVIIVTACDSWGQCESVEHNAGQMAATAADGNSGNDNTGSDDDSDDSGLPGFGLLAALGAFALAGLRASRRD